MDIAVGQQEYKWLNVDVVYICYREIVANVINIKTRSTAVQMWQQVATVANIYAVHEERVGMQ